MDWNLAQIRESWAWAYIVPTQLNLHIVKFCVFDPTRIWHDLNLTRPTWFSTCSFPCLMHKSSHINVSFVRSALDLPFCLTSFFPLVCLILLFYFLLEILFSSSSHGNNNFVFMILKCHLIRFPTNAAKKCQENQTAQVTNFACLKVSAIVFKHLGSK